MDKTLWIEKKSNDSTSSISGNTRINVKLVYVSVCKSVGWKEKERSLQSLEALFNIRETNKLLVFSSIISLAHFYQTFIEKVINNFYHDNVG